jgi:hypothetical protein
VEQDQRSSQSLLKLLGHFFSNQQQSFSTDGRKQWKKIAISLLTLHVLASTPVNRNSGGVDATKAQQQSHHRSSLPF